MQIDTTEAQKFLRVLFEEKPAANPILIQIIKPGENSKAKSKTSSFWPKDYLEGSKAVGGVAPGWNVYAGVGTRIKPLGRSLAGKYEEIAGLPGFFVDFDIGSAGHKTAGNPTSIAQVEEIIKSLPLQPTMTTLTGIDAEGNSSGVHAYYLFKEFWTFENEAERAKAQAFSTGFQRMVRTRCMALGFNLDGTHNITRVLRVPGTWNWKTPENPRQCLIKHIADDVRYDPGDFEQYADFTSKAVVTETVFVTAETDITAGLSVRNQPPNIEKLEALQSADPKFRMSYEGKRPDLKDQSKSGYDFSITSYCVRANWSDQEIIDLLVYRYRKAGEEIKPIHYYARTVKLARKSSDRDTSIEAITDMTLGHTPNSPKREFTADERNRALEYISNAFDVRIKRVIKYKQDPPRYRLVTANAEIELGTVEHLISQTSIRNAIAASEGHYVQKFKNEAWDAIAKALLNSCEVVNTGPEGTDAGAIREWVNVYLDDNPPGEFSQTALANSTPYFDSKRDGVCIILAAFKNWLYMRQGEKLSSKQLGIMLRYLDAEPDVVAHHYDDNGETKQTTRNVWFVPKTGRRRKKCVEGESRISA